jgi:hypothetical protein
MLDIGVCLVSLASFKSLVSFVIFVSIGAAGNTDSAAASVSRGYQSVVTPRSGLRFAVT